MRKITLNLILISFLIINSCFNVHANDSIFVDTTKQLYSYDEMVTDIYELSQGHEDIISYETIATTSQGRNVWLIKFGNLSAENKILITASIHAREYMTSQLVMRMLEEYIVNFDVPRSDGTTYRQCFDTVCFYILPMVNPDGVSISQFGAAGATMENTINWLNLCSAQGINLSQIKANANGVDLNRNFPLGFGLGSPVASSPSMSYYPGTTPLSEPETFALATLITNNSFVTGINYHSMGNIIYYGASTNTSEVNAACKDMAYLAKSINGYRLKFCGNAIGSLADYFGAVQNSPSITIEIGTANPVPISQFNTIYNKNVSLWSIVAALY